MFSLYLIDVESLVPLLPHAHHHSKYILQIKGTMYQSKQVYITNKSIYLCNLDNNSLVWVAQVNFMRLWYRFRYCIYDFHSINSCV